MSAGVAAQLLDIFSALFGVALAFASFIVVMWALLPAKEEPAPPARVAVLAPFGLAFGVLLIAAVWAT